MSRPGWMVGGGALALAGVVMLLGPAGMASGTAGPSMSISPPSQNIDMGTQEISIEIKANNVTNLGAYDFVLEFDPGVLEYIGSGDYGFLTTTGRTQTCFGYGLGAATVNGYGALKAGCGTNGLISNGQGKPGPNGSATLAQVVFKAKGIGSSALVFKGLGNDKYYFGAADPDAQPADPMVPPPGTVEVGQTSLTFVEVCAAGNCEEQDIPFAPGTGVIAVIDPNAPAPTALPPTPTAEPPSDVSNEDFQKTVASAVGTPRTLPTPVAGSAEAATATAVSQANGSVAAAGSSGTGSGTTAATTSGSAAVGVLGELPEGATIGPDGIVRGPDGVPIAGYGPQKDEPSPLWLWAGVALLLWGLVGVGWGALTAVRARDIDM